MTTRIKIIKKKYITTTTTGAKTKKAKVYFHLHNYNLESGNWNFIWEEKRQKLRICCTWLDGSVEIYNFENHFDNLKNSCQTNNPSRIFSVDML